MLLPSDSPPDRRKGRSGTSAPTPRFDLEPMIGVSSVIFGAGTLVNFYLIFTAAGVGYRSVLTALALLIAFCACIVALLVLGRARFRDGRSRAASSAVQILSIGWFLISLPMWIADRSWWAVGIALWAVVIMCITLRLQWARKAPTRTRP